MAADHARKTDPTLAARYHRLMVQNGKHHTSALCTIAAVLLTRIAACLRSNTPYQLHDIDGTLITEEQGRAIVSSDTRSHPKRVPHDVSCSRRPAQHEGTSGPRQESLRAPRHRSFYSQHEPSWLPLKT